MAQSGSSSDELVGDVRRRAFVARHATGDPVPVVLWSPQHVAGPLPLILLGHGGGFHKTHPVTELWRARLMSRMPLCVASIDFPEHGERGGITSAADSSFLDLLGDPHRYEQAGADLSLALSRLLDTGEIEAGAVGYFGLSLGAWFGFPFVADEDRLCAAVLGLIGVGYPTLERAGRSAPSRGAWERAADISVPTAFIVQWDDEAIPRDAALAAFDLIGAKYKRLLAAPGAHAFTPGDVFDVALDFLASRFAGDPEPDPLLAPLFGR